MCAIGHCGLDESTVAAVSASVKQRVNAGVRRSSPGIGVKPAALYLCLLLALAVTTNPRWRQRCPAFAFPIVLRRSLPALWANAGCSRGRLSRSIGHLDRRSSPTNISRLPPLRLPAVRNDPRVSAACMRDATEQQRAWQVERRKRRRREIDHTGQIRCVSCSAPCLEVMSMPTAQNA
jgi:hypothetical protein